VVATHTIAFSSIPFGYWSIPLGPSDTSFSTSVEPYIAGAWPYLLRALSWAHAQGLHVILDVHGAPGSQNGYDNSGQRTNDIEWAYNSTNVNRTLDVIKFVIKNTGGLVDVMELLNEPAGFLGQDFVDVVRQFWLDGYNAVRNTIGGGMKVMIGDAFLGVQVLGNLPMGVISFASDLHLRAGKIL
jgi:glucan 1,3-beta-glucosidase